MTQQPTNPEARIDALDILRGFVLFGVLIVNVLWTISGPPFANPNRADDVLGRLIFAFFSYKSLATFSLLFGLGLTMQSDKARKDGSSFASFLFRRQSALLLIGAVHVALIWDGDVLMSYAILGVLLLPLLKAPRKALVALSVLLYVVYELIHTGILNHPAFLTMGAYATVFGESSTMASAYAHGTWMQAAAYGTYTPWILEMMAFFVAGVVVWRSGVFQSPATHRKAIRRIAHATFWSGVVISLAIIFPPESIVQRIRPLAKHLFDVSVPLLVAGYVFGILNLVQTAWGRKALGFLGPVGRMALTNYLMQSAVGVTAFYGWGFGRWGIWHTWQITAYALVLFAVQAILSRWWLGRYRFGPNEWLWRSMTYGQLPLDRLPALRD